MACRGCGAPTDLMDAHCPKCGQSLAERESRSDRPFGITFLALYVGAWGLLAVVPTLPVLVFGGVTGAPIFRPSDAPLLSALAVLLPVLGILYLTLAYGLWTHPRWAYPLALALFVVGPGVDGILRLTAGSGTTQALLTLGEWTVAVAALMYLPSEEPRAYFGRSA